MVSNTSNAYSRVQHPDDARKRSDMFPENKLKLGTSSRFYRTHLRSFKCNTLLYCVVIALATYGLYYLVYWRNDSKEDIVVGNGATNMKDDIYLNKVNPKFANGVQKQVLNLNDRKGYDHNDDDDNDDFVDDQRDLQNHKSGEHLVEKKEGVDRGGLDSKFEDPDDDIEDNDDDDDALAFHAVLVEDEREDNGENDFAHPDSRRKAAEVPSGDKNKEDVNQKRRSGDHNQDDIRKMLHDKLLIQKRKQALQIPMEVQVNPDYRAVEEYNKNPKNQPKLPKFNPNNHIPPKANENANKEPHPSPKEFPVQLLHTPTIRSCPHGPFMLIVVLSNVRETAIRSTIRKTWGSPTTFNAPHIDRSRLGWWVIFAIGNDDFKMDIRSESVKSGDVLQGDFLDLDTEETRKVMMAMMWLNGLQSQKANCRPMYVLKTSSRVFVNAPLLSAWVSNTLHQANNVYAGQVLHQDAPIRDQSEPHYVPFSDFSKEFFPDIVRGPTFLLSIDVVYRMVALFPTVTPIAMDDSYIGILASELGIKPHNDERFVHLKRPTNVCQYRNMMLVYGLSSSEHRHVFNVLVGKSGRHCLNEGL